MALSNYEGVAALELFRTRTFSASIDRATVKAAQSRCAIEEHALNIAVDKMAAQLAAQQDDETSEIVLRAACADGGLDASAVGRAATDAEALITLARATSGASGRTCCGGCARAEVLLDAQWRRGGRAVLLEQLDGAPAGRFVSERNPMRQGQGRAHATAARPGSPPTATARGPFSRASYAPRAPTRAV